MDWLAYVNIMSKTNFYQLGGLLTLLISPTNIVTMNPILKIRTKLGVTQRAVAEAIGVTQGNFSNYERGQSMPPNVAKLLISYAESMGCQITFNDVYAMELPT
jgi:putative transcriptional regulator